MPKKKKNKDSKSVKPAFYIYCEGDKTEPNYFSGYIEKFFLANRGIQIKIQAGRRHTPSQLVEEAIDAKKKSLKGDIFWVVYDRESTQAYSDELHEKVYKKAQDNGISIAISNVCFEVWLLLHFQDTSAPYNSYNDLITHSQLNKEWKLRNGNRKWKLRNRNSDEYSKSDEHIFYIFRESEIKDARNRANKLNALTEKVSASGTKPYQLNPYTDVYKLLDAIDKFVRNY